jgi:hypothetical protein
MFLEKLSDLAVRVAFPSQGSDNIRMRLQL